MLATEVANAQVQARGFQIPIESITEENMARLVNTWKAKIVRIQIGNNSIMDGRTGAAYIEMMNEAFGRFDAKLPLLRASGLGVVFALYSPPGGFQTRQAPSHYSMFSDPSLQSDFVAIWEQILNRYGNEKSIIAFDLLNEPALRTSLLCANCDNWPALLKRTVAAIRAKSTSTKIMVKSLYGDPTKLTALPLLNDPNIIYSYHAYPFNRYQGSGFDGIPASLKRPTKKAIELKMINLVGRFFDKAKRAHRRKEIPVYPPPVNVGEFTVSPCALQQPEKFLDDLLSVIEKRRGARLKSAKTPRQKAFAREITYQSWTYHAFDEFPAWDPRAVCGPNGEAILDPNAITPRSEVLLKYLRRS
jgi:hypothetical protein